MNFANASGGPCRRFCDAARSEQRGLGALPWLHGHIGVVIRVGLAHDIHDRVWS